MKIISIMKKDKFLSMTKHLIILAIVGLFISSCEKDEPEEEPKEELIVAEDFAFRTDQANASSFSYINVTDVDGEDDRLEVCDVVVTTTDASCMTSSASYESLSFDTQTGNFEATFNVTPLADEIDVVVGLSPEKASGHSDMACIVRFKFDQYIYARNGGEYQTPYSVVYEANMTYSFRVVVDLDSKTYDVYVTPQ